ncbi:DUF6644 family protein [Povalibacter sp.]|uniref:DUF6644 family protein n=1 Tax=Povalibacter sp. TaxID=1962978 RepID=UPI002F42D275
MTTLVAFAETIEQWPLAVAIAESRYAFPLIEGAHLIGLSIAVGLLFITDLRLAGVVLKRLPAMQVLHQLRPWVLGGFVTIFITGGLLFLAGASTLVTSAVFAWKLLFILLAGINAAYFEFVIAKKTEMRDGQAVLPAAAKFAAIASLSLWTVVIVCGRLIPYLS